MRTESDMIAKSPIKVMLGSAEYEIHPLPIKKARAWRTQLNEIMAEVVEPMQQENMDGLGPALTAALIKFPDKMLQLVLAFQPSLSKEKIEEEATEEQITVAFNVAMRFAYPFLAPLQATLQVVKSQ
jgi:hypothetical protein